MGPGGNDAHRGPCHPRRRPRKSQGVPRVITAGGTRRVEPRQPKEGCVRRLSPDESNNGSSAEIIFRCAWVVLFASVLLTFASWPIGGMAEARSLDFASYGSYGSPQDNEWRITCYTCMNVSNNEECNRYAIDRPCPEGRDYCLTLHVMDGLEFDRSVLVNKRCAYLDECTGDSTGCTTSDGQTQCVSCCDQPYCNDYAPSNETSAMFHRSSAAGMLAGGPRSAGRSWMLISMFALLSTLRSTKSIHLLS